MKIDTNLIQKFLNVTTLAAISSYKHIGKKDKIAADKSAVDVMRDEINKLPIDGEIVIGEGELDKAPMLYIGERLGNRNGPRLDIAVDPVEGTNFVANNMPGGLSVLAIAESKNLFKAPETYMDKIATGPDIPKGAIDLDYPVEKNIKIISEITGKQTSDITACILDRPRHQRIINELNKLKVNIKLISDGDVSGALLVSDKKYNVDIFLGIGGGPEGVLAASALDSLSCNFQGRFLFHSKNEINRARKMGIKDLSKKYDLNEIVKGESVFFATGITDGDLVNGVKNKNNMYITETLVTHKNNSNKIVKNQTPST